jgi:hypothetical protein
LEYVDEGRIAFTPAVELSYLNDIEQQDLRYRLLRVRIAPLHYLRQFV